MKIVQPHRRAMPAIIAITPQHRIDPGIAIAACRAHALGLLDLGIRAQDDAGAAAIHALRMAVPAGVLWGLRCDLFDGAAALLKPLELQVNHDRASLADKPVLLLAGVARDELKTLLKAARRFAGQVLLEVCNLQDAIAAQHAGFDGLVFKGNEAGGRVSQRSAFILAQEVAGKLVIPYWIEGGIGMHSAGAVVMAGAAGVVLCEQLWLAAEAPGAPANLSWEGLDGSETVLAGTEAAPYRCFSRGARTSLREIELAVARNDEWRPVLLTGLLDRNSGLIAASQDLAFAAPLAARYGTVGRIVTAMLANMAQSVLDAEGQRAMAEGAALAAVHGTRFPIAQGPMTRVSDVAAFAQAVATEGALPFVALAVMREADIATMLAATRDALGTRPWGVGILGFMPLALRQEQLRVLRDIRPPFAIVAGGRPSQARELDQLGIRTYLHVPSPGLLKGFFEAGSRRFIFEGSECGGHTGPRSSFVLWQQAVDILCTVVAGVTNADGVACTAGASVEVLFAGGIHDARSAAMVAVLAAPLVAIGVKVGVLMGTAYLFTHEIVASGAIVDEFQRQAIACEDTALLQSGVGIYTRCARTDFCGEFESLRRQLVIDNKSEEDTLMALEMMNIGRLRIASKGVTRNSAPDAATGPRYLTLDAAMQRREGLYMLGEVARLRAHACSLAELHGAVSAGSVDLLAHYVAHLRATAPAPVPRAAREEIAIVGMACHFPRARGLREYWQNIVNGVDAIREVTDDRWSAALLFDPQRGVADKVYAKWGGFLDDIAFDPQRYGIAPATLASIEPAQLLTLEVARQALEDAGFDRRPFPRDRTACIMAVGGMNDLGTIFNFRTLLPQYLARVDGLSEQTRSQILDTLFEHALPKWTEDTFPGILGNVVAGRIANRLDLGGSNFTVDAACAASLAALEVGVRQLRDGDADVALIGGVDCTNSPIGFMCFAQTHALSPRGRSRPFDDGADGIAISEGVGAMVLKRRADAERDGDRIYALIKGVGSASDGRNRSLTAPHPPGQVRALRRAYADAGVDPARVTLIEGHGTGTALGDRSELTALAEVLGKTITPVCALDSVKSMIGHTKVAAGMAGLIKAALALQHRVLPATLGVDLPARALRQPGSSMYVNGETRPWLHTGRTHPRYCGVSAFGFGGTNFHAVLAEYTGACRSTDVTSLNPRDAELFAFAGADRAEIVAAIGSFVDALTDAPAIDLAQLAFSLYREQHVLRRANGGQPCRLVVVAAGCNDLVDKLNQARAVLADGADVDQKPGVFYRESVGAVGAVCFLFPGQGAQRVNMLRELVIGMPALHRHFQHAGIAEKIYPQPAYDDRARSAQQQELNATDIAQPALGMVSMAAFEVLTSYGLHPDFMAGHSYGEYAALCAGGAFTSEALLALSMTRGSLCSQAPPGAMAALDAGIEVVGAAIERHGLAISIANLNAPDQTVVAGTVEAIDAACAAFLQDGMRVKRLAVGSAFHCAHMAPVAGALGAALATVAFQEPRVPVYANLTAAPYPAEGAAMRQLLERHITEPVRFADEIEALYAAGARVFVECGPGLALTGLVARVLGQRAHTVLALDAPGRNGWVQLAHLLSQAIAAGLPVDLAPWFDGRGLAPSGIGALVDAARARAAPGPLVWRVNGGRALPWHAALRPARAPAIPAPLTPPTPPTPSIPPTLSSVTATTVQPRRIKMDTGNRAFTDELPDHAGYAGAPASAQAATDHGIAQIDEVFTRLLDFQSAQQHTLHQFFALHAGIAGIAGGPPHLAPLAPFAPLAPPPPLPSASRRPPVMRDLPAPSRVMPPVPEPAHTNAIAGPSGVPARIPVLPLLPGQDRAAAGANLSAGRPILAGTVAAVGAATAVVAQPASPEEFSAELLRAVSERTGYPVDMLDMDAHMEADLGIDSIKRIEIFSGLTQRHSLVGERDEETMIEELSGFKTLREVVTWYTQLLDPAHALPAGGSLPKKASTPLSRNDEEVESHARAAQRDAVQCYVVQTQATAPVEAGVATTGRGSVAVLVARPSMLAEALRERLLRCGYTVCQFLPGLFTRQVDASRYEVDFDSAASVEPLLALLAAQAQPVGLFINLMGWSGNDPTPPNHRTDARALFMLLKLFGPQLKRDAARLINVTGLGGDFGLSGTNGAAQVASAGTLGVTKSAAREWGQLRVKCIDAAPALAPGMLADRILAETFSTDQEIEVGFGAAGRCIIVLAPREACVHTVHGLALPHEAVLLAIGGAYGITAELTRLLVDNYRPRLVIVGRSPLPGEEAGTTRGIDDSGELRRRITAQLVAAGQRVTPVLIDAQLVQLRRARDIRRQFAALDACGCQVEYHSLDVRDTDALGCLIDDIYQRLGRIDGVLHGAGVISDKLIASKPLDAFDRVFDTKVAPALLLANKLRLDALRFIVFFSSVAGRFGNIGQADYSAANEVLNKLAATLARAHPTLHALAINWGPWDAGMVSDDLRRLYAARGIWPIPVDVGRRHFLDALEREPGGPAELVISSSIRQIAALRLGRQDLLLTPTAI